MELITITLVFLSSTCIISLEAQTTPPPPPTIVLRGEIPFQVSIQFYNDFWGYYESSASGVILDETHVLSVQQYWPLEDLSIASGVTHLWDLNLGIGKRHAIKNVR
jgi:hypothetical protein